MVAGPGLTTMVFCIAQCSYKLSLIIGKSKNQKSTSLHITMLLLCVLRARVPIFSYNATCILNDLERLDDLLRPINLKELELKD